MSEFLFLVLLLALLVTPMVMKAVDFNRRWRGGRTFSGGTIPSSKIGSVDVHNVTGSIQISQIEAAHLHTGVVTDWIIPDRMLESPRIWSVSLPVLPPAEPSTPPQAGGRLIRRTYPAKRRRAKGKGRRGGGR